MLFELFQVPALYFENQGILSAYHSQNETGCIVDIGSNVTYIAPYTSYKICPFTRLELGGNDIAGCLQDGL